MATDEHVDIPGVDDDDDDRQRQIIVSDPEDFARTRQLRTVFDARDNYVEGKQRVKADVDIVGDMVPKQIWNLIQRFAFAIEPLATNRDSGKRFWQEKTYSVANFALPEDVKSRSETLDHLEQTNPDFYKKYRRTQEKMKAAALRRKKSRAETLEKEAMQQLRWDATPKPAKFQGISDMIGRTPRLAYLSPQGNTDIKYAPPPVQLSDEVFRDLNLFLDTIGLGFDMQTEQQTKIDDDLLSEVNEWRQKNT